MGACASKPKDLDTQEALIPEAPLSPKKLDIQAAPEENKEDGEETKKEEPLVDLTEPAQEASKAEEAVVETENPKAEEVVLSETASTAAVVKKLATEEDNKATKVGDEDEKKEEVVAVVDEVVVVSPPVATVSEVKTETPVTA